MKTSQQIRIELDQINEQLNTTSKENPIYWELVKKEEALLQQYSDRQADVSKYGRGMDPEECYYYSITD